MLRAIGRPPIHPIPFVAAKLAVAVSWGSLLAAFVTDGLRGEEVRLALAAPLLLAGAVLLIAGAGYLGPSLRVGLPDEPTRLKCHGVYRITRNPIYLGVYLTVAASVIVAPTALNIVAAIAAVALHHLIVRAEERFLAERFGAEWEEYRRRVPRYLWRSRM